jgi:hypothetical protein
MTRGEPHVMSTRRAELPLLDLCRLTALGRNRPFGQPKDSPLGELQEYAERYE